MTGGQAFVWDPKARLTARLNPALVEAARPDAQLLEDLRWVVERHQELTGSARAGDLLRTWNATVEQMWVVAPIDRIRRMEAQRAGRVAASA
jgi:glutamate synthase (NADPH/NADH) large chain